MIINPIKRAELPSNPTKEEAYAFLLEDLTHWAASFVAPECYHPDGYEEEDELRAAEVLGIESSYDFARQHLLGTFVYSKDTDHTTEPMAYHCDMSDETNFSVQVH